MQNTARLIKASEYLMTPWKNGKGQSSEISIFPAGASFATDPFLWRLSSAQIQESGPFSEFPGYERYLTVINQSKITLSHSSLSKDIHLKQGGVTKFSGSGQTACTLHSTPALDLNLIFKSPQVQASFNVVEISKKPRSFHLTGQTVLIFASVGDTNASLYPGETSYKVQTHHTLRIENCDSMVLLEPKSEECSVAIIELTYQV